MNDFDELDELLEVRELDEPQAEALASGVVERWSSSRRRLRLGLALAAVVLLGLGVARLLPPGTSEVPELAPVEERIEAPVLGEYGIVASADAVYRAEGEGGRLMALWVESGSVRVQVGEELVELQSGEAWVAAEPEPEPRDSAAEELDEPASKEGQALREGLDLFDAGEFAHAARRLEQEEGALAQDAAFWRGVALLRAGDPEARAALEDFQARYPASTRRETVAQLLRGG